MPLYRVSIVTTTVVDATTALVAEALIELRLRGNVDESLTVAVVEVEGSDDQ